MKISHFCNSFLSISFKNSTLFCDPWVGHSKNHGWFSYPMTKNYFKKINKYKPDYIYISHLHADHLDEMTIKSLYKKNQKIIIKNFKAKILRNRLISYGFKNILEIMNKKNKINPDFSVVLVPQMFPIPLAYQGRLNLI